MCRSTIKTPVGSERTRVKSSKPAVILVGHGSKAKSFDGAMKQVARELRKGPYSSVRCAYLEITRPSIPQAVKSAVRSGAREIRLVPYFVLSGRHIREHIPQIAREERARWKKTTKVTLCPYLGYDKRIVEVVKERVKNGR